MFLRSFHNSYMYVCVHVCVSVYTCMCVGTYICMCVYTEIYIYTHTYIKLGRNAFLEVLKKIFPQPNLRNMPTCAPITGKGDRPVSIQLSTTENSYFRSGPLFHEHIAPQYVTKIGFLYQVVLKVKSMDKHYQHHM